MRPLRRSSSRPELVADSQGGTLVDPDGTYLGFDGPVIAGGFGNGAANLSLLMGAKMVHALAHAETVPGLSDPNGLTRRYATHAPADGALYGIDFRALLPPGNVIVPGVMAVPGTPAMGSVTGISLTTEADYTVIPAVTIDPPPAGGTPATATASLTVSNVTIDNGGSLVGAPSPVGYVFTFPNGIQIQVTGGEEIPGAFLGDLPAWTITSAEIVNGGTISGPVGTPVPANPMSAVAQSGSYTIELWPQISVDWEIGTLTLTNGGSGYTSIPNVVIDPGPSTAAATAQLVDATPPTTVPTPLLQFWTNTPGLVVASSDFTIDPNLGVQIRGGRSLLAFITGGVAGQDYQLRWVAQDSRGNLWQRTGLLLCARTS